MDNNERDYADEEKWEDAWIRDWTRQDYLNQELEEYENTTEMDHYEKRALRKWVASGHSVYEPCESKYLGNLEDVPEYHNSCFLYVYRLDREINRATKGMSRKEKAAYVAGYFGFDYWEPEVPTQEEIRLQKAIDQTPEVIRDKGRMLYRERDWLWYYILSKEGLESAEAHEFMNRHMKEAALSEDEWWKYDSYSVTVTGPEPKS